MKIAYNHQIFSTQRFGGISRYFVELARNISLLKKNEDVVKIVSPIHINYYLTKDINNFFFQGFKIPDFKSSGRICNFINSLLAPIILNVFDPDLIHDTYYNSIKYNKSRVKKIITVHDMTHELFSDQFSKTDKTSEMKRVAIKEADHIICVSKNTQKDLLKIFNVNIDKTSVVHHGYSLFVKNEIKHESSDKPYLLYVGGRDGYKNFSRFIEAYADLDDIKNNYNIIVFSEKSFTQNEFQMFRRLKINSSNIKMIKGNDLTLAKYYQNASLFVYPSLYEGFGIPPLEAMSYGCPVACSNTSSIPEVVGNAAILFDPYSADSIGESIRAVLFDQNLKTSLIAEGFNQVNKFSWEKCAEKTFEVYKKVLE
tara:strand:+ start:9417 stop:10523 length:1107 start_codon:yes stop_codon:yes gene_type:complete